MGWLVRYVLQYGPEAEVLEPEVYRNAVRRAVVQ
jgi:predicted DNA-binding transcriptional regulator YafY